MLPEAIDGRRRGAGCASATPRRCTAPGRAARRRVEESRETLAAALGARPSEVILTAGGTESDNLAVKGIYWARRDADPRRRRVIVSAVEHHAVLDAAEWLAAHEGAELTCCRSTAPARSRPTSLRAAIDDDPDDVALVSVMWANNEVGTIQPIARAGRDRPRATASRCTATPCRPSARCRSTSPPPAWTR